MIIANKELYAKGRHKMQFAPMVDCVFLLLIFFLVASEIRPVEGDFDTKIPAGRGQADVNKMDEKVVIPVWVADTPNGPDIRLGGEAAQVTVPNFAALADRLAAMRGDSSLVVIDGPPDVSMQTIAEALDATVKAKIPSMTFSDPEIKKLKALQ